MMSSKRTLLFLDTEFTGLQQQGALISLALVADDNHWFYAEFTDYDPGVLSEWHRQHVLPHLYFPSIASSIKIPSGSVLFQGNRQQVAHVLREWLASFDQIEIWADVLAYDWVFFCELFGGALHLPSNIFYIPFDFATLLRARGLDADTDRLVLSGLPADTKRHNALNDALILNWCFYELMAEGPSSQK